MGKTEDLTKLIVQRTNEIKKSIKNYFQYHRFTKFVKELNSILNEHTFYIYWR